MVKAPFRLWYTREGFDTFKIFLSDGGTAFMPSLSDELAATVDLAAAPFLQQAAQAMASAVLHLMGANLNDEAIQEGGCKYVVQILDKHPPAVEMFKLLKAEERLANAVRAYPHARPIQELAQWGLLKLVGLPAIYHILQDPELSASHEAVHAGLWCLAADPRLRQYPIPIRDRTELAAVAAAAVHQHGQDDPLLVSNGLSVVGIMLRCDTPDANHAAAADKVGFVLELMARCSEARVQHHAAMALAHLVLGNSTAESALQGQQAKLDEVLDYALATFPTDKRLVERLCRVRCAVQGPPGLLASLARHTAVEVQEETLRAIGVFAEDSDPVALIHCSAVATLMRAMESSGALAVAGISALGRVMEFLLVDPSARREAIVVAAIQQGTTAIMARLQQEVSQPAPDAALYAAALEALRNISRRDPGLQQHIAGYNGLTAALDVAFERDYYSLQLDSLVQLLGAVHFFAGFSRLQELLQRYPGAVLLQEAGCSVLVDEAEQQEGVTAPGSVLGNAVWLASYATNLLTQLVPNKGRDSEQLPVVAAKLLGIVLGFVPEAVKGPETNDPTPTPCIFEAGVEALIDLLECQRRNPEVVKAVCMSISRIALTAYRPLFSIMSQRQVGQSLLGIVSRFADDAEVLSEVAIAMGLLGGISLVVQLMVERKSSSTAQLAGCTAISDLLRFRTDNGQCIRFQSQQEKNAAEAAVQDAALMLQRSPSWYHEGVAEVAIGLVSGS